jgi:methylated-DNA-[protein]-cysteine S-methyltransferase
MADAAGIYAREFPYLGRYVQLGIAQARVLSVEFPDSPDDEASGEHELLDRIEAYLDGTKDGFTDVAVAMTMRTDYREVLTKVREIPHGESATVQRITAMVPGRDPDKQDDQRLVREAIAANQTPIFVPSHRVRDGPGAAPAAVIQKLRSIEGL